MFLIHINVHLVIHTSGPLTTTHRTCSLYTRPRPGDDDISGYLEVDCCALITFLCALLSLQVQVRNVHNKTIIGYSFRLIAITIKASVSVIRLSLRLRQITQTLALIIIAIMPNLIQQLLNNICQMPKISAMKDDYTAYDRL